jgi:hypothetical protein
MRVDATENGVLRSLTVDEGGTVNVHATFSLLHDVLPTVVTQLRRGDLHMVHRETWTPVDVDRLRGQVDVELSGAPMSTRGTGLVTPTPKGSLMSYTAVVAVKLPLIGGAVEALIGSQLATWVRDVQRVTSDWITAQV